ncbi:nucleotide exchange factor GrpE [Proteiniclasticum sp. SCR006]|uniref:Protein GrpE n=1 Tax=Proteiniclasticum aestuarii TaxID=2817862 RepID=A0A939H9D1_9CLOT|nr:nucleotide exchange factor GrpE [Proteiniclasticum aestuarii]MBO1263876.1 nucleotide exchange factor GrpE [Proteiniclasticum aestuarii]
MTEDKNRNPKNVASDEVNPQDTVEEAGMDQEVSVEESEEMETSAEDETAEEKTEEQVENTIDMKELFRKKKEMLDGIRKLENENQTLKDRLARLNAEYENYRKRTQKEKDGIYTDSIVEVVKELLPVLDNLEASLKVESADVESLRKGVEMTLTQFRESLQKLKVTEIDTEAPFDPNFHEAVMHVDDPSLGEKEIAQVFLKGYQRDEKIIRYSVVKVAN